MNDKIINGHIPLVGQPHSPGTGELLARHEQALQQLYGMVHQLGTALMWHSKMTCPVCDEPIAPGTINCLAVRALETDGKATQEFMQVHLGCIGDHTPLTTGSGTLPTPE